MKKKLAALAEEALAAYQRDELAEALASCTKPRFYICAVCFGWHASPSTCKPGAAKQTRYTSGQLNHRYGYDGWERVETYE